jgi:uncharacterized delta-60 repeat protein
VVRPRLNPDGSLDPGFSPKLDSTVPSVAVQPDRKLLVAGRFTTVNGHARSCLARLNPDGTLDPAFAPTVESSFASPEVACLAVQPDGDILVGGSFTSLCGQPRISLGRLKADGTLDGAFRPDPVASGVNSQALLTDGRIVVVGYFSSIAGQPRSCLARLQPDGILDGSFGSQSSALRGVSALAIDACGNVSVGGMFRTLGGRPRTCLGRLQVAEPATQDLQIGGTTLTWRQSGAGPEVGRTALDWTTNGLTPGTG